MESKITFKDDNRAKEWTAVIVTDTEADARAYAEKVCKLEARIGRKVSYRID